MMMIEMVLCGLLTLLLLMMVILLFPQSNFDYSN